MFSSHMVMIGSQLRSFSFSKQLNLDLPLNLSMISFFHPASKLLLTMICFRLAHHSSYILRAVFSPISFSFTQPYSRMEFHKETSILRFRTAKTLISSLAQSIPSRIYLISKCSILALGTNHITLSLGFHRAILFSLRKFTDPLI